MYLKVLLPSILALYALYKKKITNSGIIAAWLMALVIIFCGGIYPFIALALTFIFTIISDTVKKKDVDKKRDIYQMISNVLTCTLCTILYYIKQSDIFLVMYYAVLSGSLADTLASSIGSLAKGKNINPLTFREMKKGESGAVSSLGMAASFLGGLILGGIYYLNGGYAVYYLIIIIMGALGSYIDSVAGAYLQVKYECKVCKEIVEHSTHCGKKANKVKGWTFMDNDAVNLISNIVVFIATYIVLLLR